MAPAKYKRGEFRSLFGCKHDLTTDAQLDNPSLTPVEKQYINQLYKALGSNPRALMDIMGGLLWAVDNSWSSADIFYNCHNAGADWNRFKGDAAARNTSIAKMVGDELNRRGIQVNFGKDQGTAIFNAVDYTALSHAANQAVSSNAGVTKAFTDMAFAYNFDNLDDDVKTFMAAPENANNIRDAVKVLNYVIPTSNDQVDIAKFKQIYWGAYFLKQFPVPSGLLGVDCGQIGQTLIQLAAEKANLKQNDLDHVYAIYTEGDMQQQMQAVADLTTRFNGLYAQQNCTAAQTGGGNDVMKYVLLGLGAIFVILIARKILHGRHHGKAA